MSIIYLIIGVGITFIIPLGILKIAIYFSNKQNKRNNG